MTTDQSYIALLAKVSSGVEKGTQMSKVHICFSSNKLTKWNLYVDKMRGKVP